MENASKSDPAKVQPVSSFVIAVAFYPRLLAICFLQAQRTFSTIWLPGTLGGL
jgi:hypothetical protein